MSNASTPRAGLLDAVAFPQAARPPRLRELVLLIVLASPVFGLAMGSFDLSSERWLYPVFSAVKLPIMIGATWLICLPGFVALCSVLRLREDLPECLRAILCGQAAVACTLASMAPLIAFAYVNGVSHRAALLLCGGMFALATVVGQIVMLRWWRPLIARRSGGRHALLLAYWLVAYIFVGIQTGWMLRPFVGSPGVAPTFVRQERFSNAYIVVAELVTGKRR